MQDKEKYEELIEEGQKFLGKNITASDPKFIAWNNKLIRFIEKKFGKNSTTFDNFNKRNYSLSIWVEGTPDSAFVEALEADLKTSIEDLKELKKEEEQGIIYQTKGESKKYIKDPSQVFNFNINNSNTNINQNNYTIEEIRKCISDNSMIGDIEKDDLLQKLNEIEELQKSNATKNEKWKIAKNILKFIVDKGADIAIMYIPQILNALNS